jgi:hypothetical protein
MSHDLKPLNFLLEKRSVRTDFHLVQTKKWLDFDAGRKLDNVLVYAALELRCAIERLAFELLFLAKDLKLTPEEEERCKSIKEVLELLSEVEPNYRKLAEFTNITSPVGIPNVAIIDIKFIKRRWHEISNLLHYHKRPLETWDSLSREFQNEGFELVKETYEKIIEWLTKNSLGLASKSSMEPEVRELFDKYVAGEIDENEVKVRLNIAEPVFKARRRFQK